MIEISRLELAGLLLAKLTVCTEPVKCIKLSCYCQCSRISLSQRMLSDHLVILWMSIGARPRTTTPINLCNWCATRTESRQATYLFTWHIAAYIRVNIMSINRIGLLRNGRMRARLVALFRPQSNWLIVLTMFINVAYTHVMM